MAKAKIGPADAAWYDPKKMPNVRGALFEALKPYRGPFTILLSGGLDSHAVLFTLLDLGHRDITIYSARMETHESRDFAAAKHTAEVFDLPFKPLILKTDMQALKRDLCRNVKDIRIDGKVHMEAFWVYRKIIDHSKAKYIASGLAADLYFTLTKKACMHFRDIPDVYRFAGWKKLIGRESQTARMKEYARKKDKEWLSPWVTTRMLDEFTHTTWDTCNQPRQKEPVRQQFAEYLDKVRIFSHTDMHKGDSGIAANFEQLLTCPHWNSHGGRSVVGIYNRVIRGELQPEPKTSNNRPIFRSR